MLCAFLLFDCVGLALLSIHFIRVLFSKKKVTHYFLFEDSHILLLTLHLSGATGTAYTFFTAENAVHAKELVEVLRDNGADVPPQLAVLAQSAAAESMTASGFLPSYQDVQRQGFLEKGGGGDACCFFVH